MCNWGIWNGVNGGKQTNKSIIDIISSYESICQNATSKNLTYRNKYIWSLVAAHSHNWQPCFVFSALIRPQRLDLRKTSFAINEDSMVKTRATRIKKGTN